jgi:hypothetical protein
VIELLRQSLDLQPPGYHRRSASLNNLANALLTRFEQLGDLDSLSDAVKLHRQALELRPTGHPHHSMSLNNLATAMHTQFEHLGDLDSLAEAVELHRRALDLYPPGHPHRYMSLNNLATSVQTRFEHLGDVASLAEAVDLHRQALSLCPPGHPHRSASLSNLASALQARHFQYGHRDSGAEAVELNRQALDLRPLGHPHRHSSLASLASALQSQILQRGIRDSLSEVVELHHQALDLLPPGHPHRSKSLHSLATTAQSQFMQLDDVTSLAEAVDLHRQALELRPPGHPDRLTSLSNLAETMRTRYERLGNVGNDGAVHSLNQCSTSDLDEEFRILEEGLHLCADGHRKRMRFLFAIGEYRLRTGTHVFNFEEAIRHLLEAVRDRYSPARQCIGLANRALRLVEAAYQFLAQRTSAFTPLRHDDEVLQIYISVIQLLPQAASFGLDHENRLHVLSGAEAISRDGAARAISAGRNLEAVELLEEGRGVFWSQALQLRAPDLDSLPAQDAQELRKLFHMLQSGGTSDESLSTAQLERRIELRRRLSNEAEALIADIRSRPGMGRFLLPPAFSSLVQSLPEAGLVVILLASSLGHHALVLNRAESQAKSIALIAPQSGGFSEAFRATLPRDGNSDSHASGATSVFRPMSVSKKALKKPHRPLEDMLAQLWTLIVKPVVGVLNLQVCPCRGSRSTCPDY